MDFNSGKLIYFSPTHTTKKIIRAIASVLPLDRFEDLDLTLPDADRRIFPEVGNELTILGTPVYAGRVPAVAARRLKRIQAKGSPVLVVVVYGNREFEDALLELKNIAIQQGFRPFAAGAFIGEHSYSTTKVPIASGRPDESDLKKAMEMGTMVFKKLQRILGLKDWSIRKVPGNFPYKERMPISNESPRTQETLCTLCGTCATVCPTAAVVLNDSVVTEPELCILCQACVKNCPTGARITEVPRIKQLAESLHSNHFNRKEPEFFL